MTPTTRPCGATWERHEDAGLGSPVCCGWKCFSANVQDVLHGNSAGCTIVQEWDVEFGPVKPKTSGGIPHLCANGGQKARTEWGWVVDIPALRGGVDGSWFEDNCSLCGRASPDRCKLHHQSTNLWALCRSSEEERLAGLTILVEPANGLGLGVGGGHSALLPIGQGHCCWWWQRGQWSRWVLGTWWTTLSRSSGMQQCKGSSPSTRWH